MYSISMDERIEIIEIPGCRVMYGKIDIDGLECLLFSYTTKGLSKRYHRLFNLNFGGRRVVPAELEVTDKFGKKHNIEVSGRVDKLIIEYLGMAEQKGR